MTTATAWVPAWSLSAKPEALIRKKVAAPDSGDLYGTGYVGFGRVAVLVEATENLAAEEKRGRVAALAGVYLVIEP